MISTLLRSILAFCLLILSQVLIVNNIHYGGLSYYIHPYYYILFLIMLPVNFSPMLVMSIGFFMGLIVDLFMSTQGMHASAAVLLALLRPKLMELFSPRDGYEPDQQLLLQRMGNAWYITLGGLLIFLFHFWLFFIETLHFSEIVNVFIKALLSSVVALGYIFLIQYLFYFKRR